ncbi:MAG: MFS transporter [Deltaproteobacteria bacterium]|nr:MAG: MFS transporter [Deltaproteobacteria bacterium]
MRTVLSGIAALLGGVLLFLTANGLLSTLLAVRLSLDGLAPAATGLVLAAYYVGFFLGALRAQRVLRDVGHIRAFTAFAAAMTAATLLHALIPSAWAWALLRLIAGFAMAALFLITESWLNERADTENRGTVLSLYMVTAQLGLGGGQLLLGAASPMEDTLFQIVAVLFALALIPVALTRSMAPTPPPETHVPLRRLYAISPIGMVGAATAGVVQASFFAMGPVHATGIGLPSGQVGLYMATVVLGGVLLQWPLGALSDRIGREGVYAGTVAALASVCVGMVFAPEWGLSAVAGGALAFGGLLFMLYPLAVAQANDWATAHERVGVAGGLLIAYGVGAVAGPMLAGLAIELLGPGGLFLFCAAALVLLLFFTFAQLTRRPQLPAALQTPFAPVMRTSTAMVELDPRIDDPPAASSD